MAQGTLSPLATPSSPYPGAHSVLLVLVGLWEKDTWKFGGV